MGDCCSNKACGIEALKRRQASTLRAVLGINALMFVAEFRAGAVSGSAALVADSLDMLGDALVYGFSLYAIAEGARAKAASALFKGLIMAGFGLFAIAQVVYRLMAWSVPAFGTIGAVGLAALAANAICFALLWRHRADDINMSSVWLCSRNDIMANSAVIVAAAGVWSTGSGWPDIVVGAAIGALFLKSATTVVSGSVRELRRAQA